MNLANAGDMTTLSNVIPKWMLNAEFQAVIFVGLACVGAWVIFTWLIQMVFSVLWPFFAVAAILGMMPSWRKILARDFMPRNLSHLKVIGNKLIHGFNSTNQH